MSNRRERPDWSPPPSSFRCCRSGPPAGSSFHFAVASHGDQCLLVAPHWSGMSVEAAPSTPLSADGRCRDPRPPLLPILFLWVVLAAAPSVGDMWRGSPGCPAFRLLRDAGTQSHPHPPSSPFGVSWRLPAVRLFLPPPIFFFKARERGACVAPALRQRCVLLACCLLGGRAHPTSHEGGVQPVPACALHARCLLGGRAHPTRGVSSPPPLARC